MKPKPTDSILAEAEKVSNVMLTGKISISRYQGDSNGISIDIYDASSGVRFCRVDMTPEALGNAITGLGFAPCNFALNGVHLVGSISEHKHETVPIKGWSFTDDDKRTALAPFEVDGWKGSLSDIGNHHKRTESGYIVSFRRYVKQP